jgi:DNA polymerase III alpha subunit
MQNNLHGQIIFSEDDLADAVMRGVDVSQLRDVVVDHTVDLQRLAADTGLDNVLRTWQTPVAENVSVTDFDRENQQHWLMPQSYRDMDIAQRVLSLCDGTEELQRAGQELLMFQERGLFDLLRYLVYLVDTMRDNKIVWGVGRGSSVASFVLYKLGVHRVNSLYYDLDPGQFLR